MPCLLGKPMPLAALLQNAGCALFLTPDRGRPASQRAGMAIVSKTHMLFGVSFQLVLGQYMLPCSCKRMCCNSSYNEAKMVPLTRLLRTVYMKLASILQLRMCTRSEETTAVLFGIAHQVQ